MPLLLHPPNRARPRLMISPSLPQLPGMSQPPTSLSNENPFVSSTVAQQILGPSYRSYPEANANDGGSNANSMAIAGMNDSVGRSALMKMSEISRRAGEVLNGNPAGNPTSSNNLFGFSEGVGDRPPSRLWTAATNAGLINPDGSFVNPLNNSASASSSATSTAEMLSSGAGVGPTKITSRRDALAKIEELQRMRPASAGFLSNAAAKLVNAMESFGPVKSEIPPQGSENSIDSSMSDASDEVVMPSASTLAENTEQKQQEQERDAQPNNLRLGDEPWNMRLPSVPPLSAFSPEQDSSSSQQQRQEQPSPPLSMLNPFPEYTSDHEGLQVYTVGHLMPKSAIDDMSGTWSFDAGMFDGGGNGFDLSNVQMGSNNMVGGQECRADGGSPSTMASSSSQLFDPSSPTSPPPSNSGSQKLRVRRSTFVPGWAVSPRVLLVDDDAVSRKLSSKFLQVFGCKIDVAVDGVGAVNKMNLEKYDLVLMDIVMPKLDGVSATSMIRQFDHMTPIISMTSNSKPNEIMTYYHSGMNDILPKPFTKQGLLDMLEKHLMHLKVIQQMSRIPRSVGIPPLSDSAFEEAITSQAALLTRPNNAHNNELGSSSSSNTLALTSDMSSSASTYSFSALPMADDDDMGRLNPLAGMGLSDEQYNMILNGIVNGETFAGSMDMGVQDAGSSAGMKRRLDERDDDERDGKRSRFELVLSSSEIGCVQTQHYNCTIHNRIF
ncbi:hypothetical protein BT96DRAFT_358309 [Gymnopus androsaceus JB14]|uniref:Response regulatory domain-containing protein n=1 Tax=Gymnopus androsaceus JB14 TaxID=1447944 RepID=A0A6A4I3U2_9AGAR|nr:hypothetical protein BT96DRAFT_358309 [Gymnopus androsaceus JB14]